MNQRNAALEKLLRTPIDPTRAPPCRLRQCVGLQADRSDMEKYAAVELVRKVKAFDSYFAIKRNSQNDQVWLRRLLALIEGHGHSQVPDSILGFKLFLDLGPKKFRGFAIARVGRPKKWTAEDCIALAADVEKIKTKNPDLSGEALFRFLRHKFPRWKKFEISALRKAYSRGNRERKKYPVPTVARGSVVDLNYKNKSRNE